MEEWFPMPAKSTIQYEFGTFVLDCGTRELWCAQQRIPLTPKEFQALLIFVRAEGKALEREALVRTLWPDTVVGDGSLGRVVSVLRRHLGPEAILSVPRFGYRFVPEVRSLDTEAQGSGSHAAPETDPATAAATPESPFVPDPPLTLLSRRPVSRWTFVTAAAGIAAVAVILLSAAVGWRSVRRVGATSVDAPVRLAIMPFRNVSAPSVDSKYLADGFADDLIARLDQLDFDHLRLLARSTTRQYEDTAKSPATIRGETGADYLLEGSLEFRSQTARITTQLVNTHDQAVVWTHTFDGPLEEVGGEEDTIANRVAAYPGISAHREGGLFATGQATTSAEARQDYLLGQEEMHKSAYPKALLYFERAVELDPQYADAYVGVANVYIYRTDLPFTFCFRKAREAAMAALRTDDRQALAHRALGYLDSSELNDNLTAETEFKRAIALSPSDLNAHNWYATVLAAERRYPEALREAAIAHELDPKSPGTTANYGFLLAQSGQAAHGLEQLKSALRMDPNSEMIWGFIGIAYLNLQKYDEAATAFQHAAGSESFHPSYLADAAYARSKVGDASEARKHYSQLQERLQRHEWIPAQAFAITCIALGDRGQTVKWLQKGAEDHTITLFELNNAPLYSEIKNYPEFPGLVRAAGGK
jgi:TolB-like protein/DNA-binding winged helix-turn-helix (wHTH) protein/tetratricopeptide (TPR) repeat protein